MISPRNALAIILLMAISHLPSTQAVYVDLLFTEDFFPLINTRLDPLVTPGKVSTHVHHVVGGSAFSADQTYQSSRDAKCTTSNLSCDLSNYWAPQLYYKWKNGTFTAITGDGMSTYWKYPLTNTDRSDPFAEIPDDFRMLGGDINRNDVDPYKAVSFLCIDKEGVYGAYEHMPTDRECLVLRPQLHFPECWNGVDAYKADNSHVAYPVDAVPEGGKCPEGYKKIPHVFLESTYHITPENVGEGYEWYPGCFVLANGDYHGYSFHADWLIGFPHNFLTDAFHECYDTNLGEFIKDCSYIQQYRGNLNGDCIAEGDVVNELVGQHAAIPALPAGYVERAAIVKVSEAGGWYCVRGDCTDYHGSDVVVSRSSDEASSGATSESTIHSVTSIPAPGGNLETTISIPSIPPITLLPIAPSIPQSPDALIDTASTSTIYSVTSPPASEGGLETSMSIPSIPPITITPTAPSQASPAVEPAIPHGLESHLNYRRSGKRRM
ncbi:hypothetical protein I302_102092 [Kwoniella bestiolae CBS 10118]|uniref:DUF1996 domain-containing protein n=1 Tax=Kwoniella bestiolae CBS 10118 TaxID=1296100 RepID=A0A1B9GE23_9TREE|nr:hypothetical protein I302_00779 [Kwoniella bestiolae CBS 10118]OCF29279.1 hypothetical protein I302_00779 [Kwoniella bestiolae CBS 10118]